MTQLTFAGKTEFHINFNTGFLYFDGNAVNSKNILQIGLDNQPYWGNYTTKNNLLLGGSLGLQHISKAGFVIGGDLGYEHYTYKAPIELIEDKNSNTSTGASGEIKSNMNFLNAYPYVGFRLDLPIVKLELIGGADFGFLLQAQEQISVRSILNEAYDDISKNKGTNIDIRPRIQLNAYLGKLKVYIGYAQGVFGYKSDNHADTEKTNSAVFRAGIGLRF